MQEQIQSLDYKPNLLLHACCAPCATACLERLYEHFDITVLFYNPNIEREEYAKRLAEMQKLLSATAWAKLLNNEHDPSVFYSLINGLESEKEGGKRCVKCFDLRLEKTAKTAKANGFEYFGTTLTLSPLKNCDLINKLGERIAIDNGVKWLYSDFKKKNGYLRSIQLSKKYNLYRQNYCGCIYSQKPLENL